MNWELLSRYRGELMGISILWVVVFHLDQEGLIPLPGACQYVRPLFMNGMRGVDIFLLLSGIGLYCSMEKEGNWVHFYRRRANRLVVPYLFIMAGYGMYRYVFLELDAWRYVQDVSFYSFWADGQRVVWFIALIVPLYLLYPPCIP